MLLRYGLKGIAHQITMDDLILTMTIGSCIRCVRYPILEKLPSFYANWGEDISLHNIKLKSSDSPKTCQISLTFLADGDGAAGAPVTT